MSINHSREMEICTSRNSDVQQENNANNAPSANGTNPLTNAECGELFSAKDHDREFDPKLYLEGFYTSHKEDGAMEMVLFFLPGILYRLPDKIETLLDFGAGPTIYIPIAVRHRAENIYTSDYNEQNREKLVEWIENRSNFDWSNICQWISCIESTSETPQKMQDLARRKMRAVLKVNVHTDEVIQAVVHKVNDTTSVPRQFDTVVTIFCLEYASEKLEEYQRAVHNVLTLVKPGGYFVQGGVLHADEYCFGGKRFKCHYLTREQVVDTLENNGMHTDQESNNFRLIVSGEVFLLFSKKPEKQPK